MRRFSPAICAVSLLTFLVSGLPAGAKRTPPKRPPTAIQATESSTDLVLLSRPGWAKVRHDGRRRRVRLAPEERLTAIAETAAGWVAGGVRQIESSGFETEVFIVASISGSRLRLPALPKTKPLQLVPVLLTDNKELTGAAWLEGDTRRTLTVRYSDWTGVDWGPPETISPRGPGSQTGLSGVTLAGGDMLLVWSRFDGSDDEIFWSARRGSAWSVPVRLGTDNRTPDVTPTLARAGRGATLIWGRLDAGDYRLLTRDFRAGRWRNERSLGAAGAASPSVIGTEDGLFVLYRTAEPMGWEVTELGESSLPVRSAHFAGKRPERPVLSLSRKGPAGLVEFRWFKPSRRLQKTWLPR